ncbi:MAG: hypothetical protein GX409_03760, partial [candidate division Zixibacteria bacterium]|nr:hypothetical protein [candidate division Zixibacteria bacterium]
MKLKEWNVWHNTTTHLFGLPDLRVVAEKIVESGLCRAVYHTDGMAYWKQNGAIVSCEVISKNDKSGFSLNLNCKDKPDDYIAEGIYQASLMYEYEKEIYSDFVIGNLVYIRGVLDIFLLNLDGLLIRLYPMLKIYENGVITISYRILPTERDINIDYLVENIINLFKKDIHDIKLSPNIMLLDGT